MVRILLQEAVMNILIFLMNDPLVLVGSLMGLFLIAISGYLSRPLIPARQPVRLNQFLSQLGAGKVHQRNDHNDI